MAAFILLLITNSVYATSKLEGVRQIGIGDSLLAIREYDSAIKSYKNASTYYQEKKNSKHYFKAELKIVLVFYEQDEITKGLAYLERLVEEAEKRLSALSETKALLYHKKGVFHYLHDEELLAIEFTKKAVSIREKNGENRWEDIVQGYRNIGEYYDFLGEQTNAKAYLEKAFEKIASIDTIEESLKLEIYQLLGSIYQQSGDLDKAYELSSFVVKVYEEKINLKKEESFLFALALDIHGRILEDLYDFNNAINAYRHSLVILSKLHPDNIEAKANVLHNLGKCYRKMGDYINSRKILEKSILYNVQLNRSYYLELNYLNLAATYIKEGNCSKALFFLKDSIVIENEVEDKIFFSQLYDNLGDAYVCLNQLDKAVINYNKSIKLITKNNENIELLSIPSLENLPKESKEILTTLFSKAKTLELVYEERKDIEYLSSCLYNYLTMDSLITLIRQDFLAENSKLSLVKETKPIYEKAIEISLKLYKLSKEEKYKNAAFDFIQKSKAVTLSEAVRHTQSTSFLDVDLSKEKYLNIDINRLTEKSYSTDGISVEEQEQLINLKNEKEKFVKYLEQNNPAYFNYKYNDKTVDQEELINILEEETTLVEFFVGDSTCFVSTYITDNQLNIYEIPISRKRLSELVSNFTKAIYSPFVANKNKISLNETDATYANIGHELYRLLLEPLKVKTKKLIIIPDDILNTLPFDALLTQKVPEESVGYYGNKVDYNFLLYKHEISYNYGVSLMKQAKAQNYASIKTQLAVYSTPDFINQVAELKEVFGDWDEFFKVINKKGNNQSFQETANTYKYIHLSAHGILNNEDANQSYFNMSTSEDDFIPLYLSTLYNIQINAEMVVTSACDAGIGKVSAGEGILSMARGFFYAGAKSVITSLWEVQDGFTGKLLKNFYQNLKDGKDKGGALNQAKQNFIRTQGDDFARPYYWAAFVPIGKMESVEIPYLLPFNVKVLLGFIMSFFIIGLSKFLINNNQSPSAV